MGDATPEVAPESKPGVGTVADSLGGEVGRGLGVTVGRSTPTSSSSELTAVCTATRTPPSSMAKIRKKGAAFKTQQSFLDEHPEAAPPTPLHERCGSTAGRRPGVLLRNAHFSFRPLIGSRAECSVHQHRLLCYAGPAGDPSGPFRSFPGDSRTIF